MTADLIEALRLERRWTESYFDVLDAVGGDRLAASHRARGSATAFRAAKLPHLAYNRVAGVLDDDAQIDDLFALYGANERFGVDVVPGLTSRAVVARLAREGFALTAFHATFAGTPSSEPMAETPDVEVRRLDADDASLFTSVFVESGSAPGGADDPWTEHVARAEGALLAAPGWTGFLAEVEGRRAAVARVYVNDDGAFPDWARSASPSCDAEAARPPCARRASNSPPDEARGSPWARPSRRRPARGTWSARASRCAPRRRSWSSPRRERGSAHPGRVGLERPLAGDLLLLRPEVDAAPARHVVAAELARLGAAEAEGLARDGHADVHGRPWWPRRSRRRSGRWRRAW